MRLIVLIIIQLFILQSVNSQSSIIISDVEKDTCNYIKDLIETYKDDTTSQNTIYNFGFSEYIQFMNAYNNCLKKDTSILLTLEKLESEGLFISFYKPKFTQNRYFISDTLDYDLVDEKIFGLLAFTNGIEILIGDRYLSNHHVKEYVMLMGIINEIKWDFLQKEFDLIKPMVNHGIDDSISYDEYLSELVVLNYSKTEVLRSSVLITFERIIELGISSESNEVIKIVFDYLLTYVQRFYTVELRNEQKEIIGKIIAKKLDRINNSNQYLIDRIVEYLPYHGLDRSTVTDIEGNNYKTVKFNNQWWMAENLKTTKLNDGTLLANIAERVKWQRSKDPAYCWYSNDEEQFMSDYGALYNWYAVGTNKLCPSGWRAPTTPELNELNDKLGFMFDIADKIFEIGDEHWILPNEEATNETGFTALPGGYRDHRGYYQGLGECGYWWTATEVSEKKADHFRLKYNVENDGQFVADWDSEKQSGFSVRCVKDL